MDLVLGGSASPFYRAIGQNSLTKIMTIDTIIRSIGGEVGLSFLKFKGGYNGFPKHT
jgi:hypothetical protein